QLSRLALLLIASPRSRMRSRTRGRRIALLPTTLDISTIWVSCISISRWSRTRLRIERWRSTSNAAQSQSIRSIRLIGRTCATLKRRRAQGVRRRISLTALSRLSQPESPARVLEHCRQFVLNETAVGVGKPPVEEFDFEGMIEQ